MGTGVCYDREQADVCGCKRLSPGLYLRENLGDGQTLSKLTAGHLQKQHRDSVLSRSLPSVVRIASPRGFGCGRE